MKFHRKMVVQLNIHIKSKDFLRNNNFFKHSIHLDIYLLMKIYRKN